MVGIVKFYSGRVVKVGLTEFAARLGGQPFYFILMKKHIRILFTLDLECDCWSYYRKLLYV